MKFKPSNFNICSSVLLLFGVISKIPEGSTYAQVQEDVTTLSNRLAAVEAKLEVLLSDVRSNSAEVKQVQATMEIEVGVAKEVFKSFKDELENLKESINHQQEHFLSTTLKMKEDIETFKSTLKENFMSEIKNLSSNAHNTSNVLIFPLESKVETANVTGSEEITEYKFGVKSQNVVHLCLGMKRNVSVAYENIKHPVDLYLLVDIAYHNWLKYYDNESAIRNFRSTLQNISTDYRLGFGVTGDKPKLPFTNITSFSFKNHIPLTTRHFDNIVDVGQYNHENNDPKNGQLEGIFQAISCKSQVKWRKNSRKILFVVTAMPYHVQGDGDLGDISKNFDGLCSLNETGYYVNELTQDYPSENQIIEVVNNENMNVVFGVVRYAGSFQQFKNLADRLDPPAFIYDKPYLADKLSDMLRDSYQKMTSLVDLDHRKTSKDIGVKYYSNCSGMKEEKGSKCEEVKNGNLTFKFEIEMLSCPSNEINRNQILSIFPKGLQTSAEIPGHLLCNCPLE